MEMTEPIGQSMTPEPRKNMYIAVACECNGAHQPGCELALRLFVKYGDASQGIAGIADLRGTTHWMSEEAASACDKWFTQLRPLWVSERRLSLTRSECGWLEREDVQP